MIDDENLVSYINRARREVAMRAQCIRILTPISGSVVSCTLTNGGTGYSAETTAVITPPDFPSGMAPKPNGDQATATPIIQGGVIVSVDINYGGYGYYQPTISFDDPNNTGTGAAGTLQVSPINVMVAGQEVYPFSSADLSAFPGVGAIYMILSVSVLYANWRYSLACPSFSSYQASLRSFPFSYQYVPFYMAQYGRGTSGNFFMYPQPSEPYQMEWDCFCLPQEMLDDQATEAVPEPFTDAVPWLATSYAYSELQNLNSAKYYQQQFDQWVSRYATYTQPGRPSSPYGRPYW